jgi:hypothetical protein
MVTRIVQSESRLHQSLLRSSISCTTTNILLSYSRLHEKYKFAEPSLPIPSICGLPDVLLRPMLSRAPLERTMTRLVSRRPNGRRNAQGFEAETWDDTR